jgi:hypothetical protein
MKKLFVFTALAGLTLVSAAPPSHWRSTTAEREWSGNGYPPCTRTRTDRCIQLYERGVATRANLALNERLGMDDRVMAMGGPYEPVYGLAPGDEQDAWAATPPDDYPPCTRSRSDRCVQTYERGIPGDW